MKFSISEIANKSGVSVRTLHYYDKIGLLVPSEINERNGYRRYDEDDMLKLQQILFYRELEFSLKDIMEIINASEYNKEDAMKKQRELLRLKRKRLDRIIKLLDANLKGETNMSFKEFDTTQIEQAKEAYAKEVKERWGKTDAYQQSQQKTKSYGKKEWNEAMEQMDALLKKFAQHIGETPDNEKVQRLVGEWQQYITDTYYDCTKEILSGLGQMYVADERFTKNMDKFGVGTAKLISEAIAVYCETSA